MGDGIQVAARSGSTLNFAILNNPAINFNGYMPSSGGGAGIRLYANDATLSGTINGNTIIQNAGNSNITANQIDQASGIQGLFDGNSVVGLTMIGNVINGNATFLGSTNPAGKAQPYGFGVILEYAVTNSVVQTLFVQNNQIVNSSGPGFLLESDSTTR